MPPKAEDTAPKRGSAERGVSSSENAPGLFASFGKSERWLFKEYTWPMVKVTATAFFVGLLAASVFYERFRIPEKEGTIQRLEATIKNVETQRDGYRNQLQDAGILVSPLKRRALILADQLSAFAKEMPNDVNAFTLASTFDGRFGERIQGVRDELDKEGQYSSDLDRALDNQFWFNTDNAGAATRIALIAREIKTLAGNLKE